MIGFIPGTSWIELLDHFEGDNFTVLEIDNQVLLTLPLVGDYDVIVPVAIPYPGTVIGVIGEIAPITSIAVDGSWGELIVGPYFRGTQAGAFFGFPVW